MMRRWQEAQAHQKQLASSEAVMEGGGSKAEKDEVSKCEMCQKTTRESGSRCRAREGNKREDR